MTKPLYIDVQYFGYKTAHLTIEEEGIFIRLLLLLWDSSDKRLPCESAWLVRRLRIDQDQYASLANPILDEFFWNDGAHWYCKHIEKIIGGRKRNVSANLRQKIIERDGFRCVYCGDEDGPFEVDHKVPVSKGGTDDEENLCCACQDCNRSKGAKLIDEWEGPV